MTIQETSEILAVLQTAYPNFYKGQGAEDKKRAIKLWAMMFADDAYADVSAAVTALISSRSETFPPVIGEVKQKMYSVTHSDEDTAAEAWAKVRKAIERSSYYANEEWEKLPPDIQRSVTPGQLRAWAMDEDFNESVVMSQFIRSYRERHGRERDLSLMPTAARQAIEQKRQQMLEVDG